MSAAFTRWLMDTLSFTIAVFIRRLMSRTYAKLRVNICFLKARNWLKDSGLHIPVRACWYQLLCLAGKRSYGWSWSHRSRYERLAFHGKISVFWHLSLPQLGRDGPLLW